MSPFGRVALQQTIHSGLPRIQTEILAEKPLKGKTIPLIGGRQEDILQKLVGTSSKKAYRTALASATVSAVMLTMRRTVVLAVRMWTGLAAPRSTGPMAMLPPAAVLSRL